MESGGCLVVPAVFKTVGRRSSRLRCVRFAPSPPLFARILSVSVYYPVTIRLPEFLLSPNLQNPSNGFLVLSFCCLLHTAVKVGCPLYVLEYLTSIHLALSAK